MAPKIRKLGSAGKTLLALALLGVALWLASGWARRAQANDFTEYWAAGRLVWAGQNPYSPPLLLEVEKHAGFAGTTTLAMRNPPWAVPFMMPFSILSYPVAQALWLAVGLGAILLSVVWLWRLYASPEEPRWIGWIATAVFVPVATVLAIGQIGPLVLLGIAGFLDSVEPGAEGRRDALAGGFALLIAIKPHLAFLFWPVLLFWVIAQRRWRVLFGFAGATLIASLIPLAFDSRIFFEYFGYWKQSSVAAELMPTPSVLRFVFPSQGQWIEFIPAVLAICWLGFWLRRRSGLSWPDQLPLLLAISVAAVPLSWFFDQVVLLPCILQASAWVFRRNGSGLWPVTSFLGLNILLLIFLLAHRTTYWYAWTAPAWLAWYLWVRLTSSKASMLIAS